MIVFPTSNLKYSAWRAFVLGNKLDYEGMRLGPCPWSLAWHVVEGFKRCGIILLIRHHPVPSLVGSPLCMRSAEEE
jgi:hypothetical protein